MDETIRILRCHIAGRWSADEMARSFAHMRDLYNLRLLLEISAEDERDLEDFYFHYRDMVPWRRRKSKRYPPLPLLFPFAYSPFQSLPLDPAELNRLTGFVLPGEVLEVRRVSYASPGLKDFAGFGEIIGHVKDFLIYLLEFRERRRQLNSENEERELRNDALRIDNARRFVRLRNESVRADAEERRLIQWVDERQQTFIDLVDQQKVSGVEVVDEEPKNDREGG
ncbi:hypothetical protein [Botrimarina hoheduenensis]|uniref:Uncharacterized protein n=1 Tax=Botrimarina hoheduenensis TaxID=2528000 RepID=A0A5C5VRW7_9BACT|nr:hypothetical protein [Botrimarina hoheduenensis]TWT41338.1 hypothetical protein Pla111_30520 [Botrimarina hoheduenensis]